MKKSTRWIGFLIALWMIGAMLATAVSADFSVDSGNTAAWKVEDGKLVGDNTASGAAESNLMLFELPSGLTDYTVEAEMTLLAADPNDRYGAVLSNWKSAESYTGAWVRANGTVNFQRRSGVYNTFATVPALSGSQINVTHTIKLHYHDDTVDLYLDGNKTSSDGSTKVGKLSGYVAVMIKQGAKVAYDNFKVTNNATSTVLWEEDFATLTGSWGSEGSAEIIDASTFGWGAPANIYYKNTSYKFSISNQFGAEGNKSLYIEEESGNWCGMELVSADVLADVKQYVFSFKTKFDNATTLSFQFNSNGTNTPDGDWGGISWASLQNAGYNGETVTKSEAPATFTFDATVNEIAIVFDLNAGTETVYLNGTQISHRTEGVKTTAGAVTMLVRGVYGYIDDLKLESGTYDERGEVLWSENFESYELSATGNGSGSGRPEQDYTGKTAGEVIFEDDYNEVETLEDFYFVAKLNGDFKKASYSISEAVNGTPCARITGVWATVEIVPAEVFTSYDVYTVHMQIKLEEMNQTASRFGLFYNTKSAGSTADSGFFMFRYNNPVQIENLGLIGGSSTKGDGDASGVEVGTTFDFALTVNCTTGTSYAYINGEPAGFCSGINQTQSALYVLAENGIGCIDNVKVTAGTYAQYQALSTNPGGDDEGETTTAGDPTADTTVPTPVENDTTAETPATQDTTAATPATTTDAPAGNDGEAKGGCASAVGTGSVVLLTGILSLGGILLKKKKND